MIGFMVPTKPDWSGLVFSTQNLSYNSEFVHLPSWYRPQVDDIVWVRTHPLSRADDGFMAKLSTKWKGPAKVVKRLGPVNYPVSLLSSVAFVNENYD